MKRELKIENGADDLWLRAQIESVSATACQVLGIERSEAGGRTVARETVVETIDRRAAWPFTRGSVPIGSSRTNDTMMVLARRPIVSVSSITEDGVLVDVAEFEVSAAMGAVRRLSNNLPRTWPSSLIIATYVAGWVMPGEIGRNMPTDWEDAVIEGVKAAWFARLRDPSVKSENVSGVQQTDYFFGTPGQDGPLPVDAMSKLRFERDVSI